MIRVISRGCSDPVTAYQALDQMALPTLFKVWIDKQPDEKALQRAEEQHSYDKEPTQLTGKDEASSDDQENCDDVRYDLHLPLTLHPFCSSMWLFRRMVQARIAATE